MNQNIRFVTFAIFLNENRILLYKVVDDFTNQIFLRPIGGGVEFYEHSADALKREIKEEVGQNIINVKELCVLENLMIVNNKKIHNIYKGYIAEFESESIYVTEKILVSDTKDRKFLAEWYNIDDVLEGKTILLPVGLTDILKQIIKK